MTWVKVCGLRHPADVEAAVGAGADAVGFVLAPSPRRVSVQQARSLGEGLEVLRVGVTVDLRPEEVLSTVEAARLDAIQPHGAGRREAAQVAVSEGVTVLYPIAVRGPVDLASAPPDSIPLLDTYDREAHGGTGRRFDWSLVAGLQEPFVLAGGLNRDNIAEAIREVSPWGVDASSGLESAPGVKDPDLIRAFVEIAKKP